jgi:hypothetical protein
VELQIAVPPPNALPKRDESFLSFGQMNLPAISVRTSVVGSYTVSLPKTGPPVSEELSLAGHDKGSQGNRLEG